MLTSLARAALLSAAALAAPTPSATSRSGAALPAAPPRNAFAEGSRRAIVDAVVFTGTVRDSRGAALSGAVVTATVGTVARGSTTSDGAGRYTLRIERLARADALTLSARRIGFATSSARPRVAGDTVRVDFTLATSALALQQMTAPTGTGASAADAARTSESRTRRDRAESEGRPLPVAVPAPFIVAPQRGVAASALVRGAPPAAERHPGFPRDVRGTRPPADREGYDRIEENPFLAVASNPRSTFSVDVDAASYGNVRRFIANGQRPPADAVRIEELVNYFPYALPAPRGDDPLAITTEVAPAPWQPQHRLVRVALQSRAIETSALPPSNLVFLVDVSGSMNEPNKLPLVQRSLRLLVDQLREQDRVAIVVYAGAAGLVLPPTPGDQKERIVAAIDRLQAGGSTAGGDGLQLAYRVARESRSARGVTRVILATDGDFNVGVSSDGELERLVESKRAEGTYLTVLGFGTGNYQDAKMEKLAKRGNGNYAYVDDLDEARKVLVHELGATLHTVADDVKLQIEFNPAAVRGYRLIGYEDRLLRDEDFIDDAKDAGDIGAGHAVTALYEVVPRGTESTVTLRGVDPLRYGTAAVASPTRSANELLYVQVRYKRPGDATSRLMTHPVSASVRRPPSDDFRFAAAVAEWGMLLRGSAHAGQANASQVLTLARGALGDDAGGYRRAFVQLVEAWRALETSVARVTR